MKNSAPSPIPHEQIPERARTIWKQAGRLDGHGLEHWLPAENGDGRVRRAPENWQDSENFSGGRDVSGVLRDEDETPNLEISL